MASEQPNDPLESLFASLSDEPLARSSHEEGLQARVWQQTRRIQRGRRLRRRVSQVALLVVLYGLGYGTALWTEFDQAPLSEFSDTVARSTQSSVEEPVQPLPPAAEANLPAWHEDLQPHSPTLARVPEALERQAGSALCRKRSDRWRQAGDLYLSERGDVASALRCYRKMLALVSDQERREVLARDSWLLAALKRGSNERS
jgi:hypothetical protein